MAEHIVATFETEATADAAARDLETAGFPSSSIRRYGSHDATTAASGHGGFWAWLLGEEPNDTARSTYSRDDAWYNRRVTAGNVVLRVIVYDDSRIHQATAILESHHPVGIDETTDEGGTITASTGISQAVQRGTEEVVPLAKENIEVGKRTVDRGTTRIRRYVVETPVEREVTLHGERVTIERRRPTDTSVAGAAFEERTVEVHETEEVPVVEKTARVVEEVSIRKEATERTETVRDTVRREEVEITDQNGKTTPRP
jgi:uncharacterized protein (TIGR02271 family)